MTKQKKIKIKTGTEYAQVSETLEALTGLTLDDVIRQACAQDAADHAFLELMNITKMDKYLSSEKKEVH